MFDRVRGFATWPVAWLSVARMRSVRQACVWLGTCSLVSLFLALGVLMFLLEARSVVTWFVASAALAGLAYAAALVAAYFEQRGFRSDGQP